MVFAIENVVTIVVAVMASSGLWAFLQTRFDKNDNRTKLLMGLAHDRIVELGASYLKRGYITREEFDHLDKYLWGPYNQNKGNGTAKRIMDGVVKLPIKDHPQIRDTTIQATFTKTD